MHLLSSLNGSCICSSFLLTAIIDLFLDTYSLFLRINRSESSLFSFVFLIWSNSFSNAFSEQMYFPTLKSISFRRGLTGKYVDDTHRVWERKLTGGHGANFAIILFGRDFSVVLFCQLTVSGTVFLVTLGFGVKSRSSRALVHRLWATYGSHTKSWKSLNSIGSL